MTQRRCAFCGRTPVTREHGWPKWLNKVVPNKTLRRTDISDDFIPRSRGTRSSVAGAEIRAVCKSCNSGWMSDIETTAQQILGPMIQGREMKLSKDAQAIIATWLIKTCLVHSLAYSAQHQIAEAYPEFFKTHVPSNQHCVAIAGFIGDGKLTTVFHFQPLVITETDQNKPINTTPNIYFMTVAIGYFIGQVVYTKLPIDFSMRGTRLREIWPYKSDMVWPPNSFFDTTDLQKIARTEFPTLDPNPRSATLKWTDV